MRFFKLVVLMMQLWICKCATNLGGESEPTTEEHIFDREEIYRIAQITIIIFGLFIGLLYYFCNKHCLS